MTTIDCARMSHSLCSLPEAEAPSNANAATSGPESDQRTGGSSYDCTNDCVSSLGVTALVSGAAAALGCSLVPPARGLFVGASASTIIGACAAACEELEAQP